VQRKAAHDTAETDENLYSEVLTRIWMESLFNGMVKTDANAEVKRMAFWKQPTRRTSM
jgi:hypothetical protein